VAHDGLFVSRAAVDNILNRIINVEMRYCEKTTPSMASAAFVSSFSDFSIAMKTAKVA